MTNLLSVLLFAAALMFGLGTASSLSYACNEKSVQAEDTMSPIQLAMDEAEDEGSEDEGSDDGSDDDSAADE